MGYIELNDGISSRRINVPGLLDAIRIDVTGEDGPRVVVPTGVTVERRPDPGPTRATGPVEGDGSRSKQPKNAI